MKRTYNKNHKAHLQLSTKMWQSLLDRQTMRLMLFVRTHHTFHLSTSPFDLLNRLETKSLSLCSDRRNEHATRSRSQKLSFTFLSSILVHFKWPWAIICVNISTLAPNQNNWGTLCILFSTLAKYAHGTFTLGMLTSRFPYCMLLRRYKPEPWHHLLKRIKSDDLSFFNPFSLFRIVI